MMTLSDEIREYVFVAYIKPARRRGDATVVVRTGDVHKAMGLKDRMPAVCSALEAAKFEEMAGVRLVNREGPSQGANVYLTFEIGDEVGKEDARISVVPSKYRGSKEYLLVYCELIRAARYGGITTYQAIAQIMSLPLSGQHMSAETGRILGEIAEDEVKHGRPMLSALVVGVGGLPGPGFFKLAEKLGKLPASTTEQDKRRFWEEEKEAVYITWQKEFKS